MKGLYKPKGNESTNAWAIGGKEASKARLWSILLVLLPYHLSLYLVLKGFPEQESTYDKKLFLRKKAYYLLC